MKIKKGFTLIELMIAIAIIGVLATIGFTAFQGTRKSARDAKRKADMEAIRSALEMYKADKGCYPCGTSTSCPTACRAPFGWAGGGQGWATNYDNGSACYTADLENILEGSGYLSEMPHDPLGGGCSGSSGGIYYGYMYYFSSPGQNYCLYAHLENPPADSGCTGCLQSPVTNYHKNYCVKNP